jgi:hypothetical protein
MINANEEPGKVYAKSFTVLSFSTLFVDTTTERIVLMKLTGTLIHSRNFSCKVEWTSVLSTTINE